MIKSPTPKALLRLVALLCLALVWHTPVRAQPSRDERTLDGSGEVNASYTQIPSTLQTEYQSFFDERLWLKAGGFVQLEALGDFGTRGRPFALTPSQLGSPGSDSAGFVPLGEDARLRFRRTRLYLDAYSPYPGWRGGLRGYAEVDFSGKNGQLNVRHLYLTLPYFVIGRTNSAFKDPNAEPESVDPGGPNAKLGLRQQGVRLVLPVGEDVFSLGVEDPGPGLSPVGTDLSDDGLVRKVDLTAHYRKNMEWGHLQLALVRRDLSLLDGSSTQSFAGWGVGLSGQVFVDDRDNFQFEVAGGPGIGRYLNDLAATRSELGVAASGQVGTQVAWGGYLAYQHWLDEETRLNTYLSTVQVNLLGGQPADSLQRSYKISLNVMRDLSDNLRAGLEYQHGLRVSRDGTTLDGGRLEFMLRYGL